MSDKKIIIRNCPAILKMTKICDAYETTRDLPVLCKDCSDCVMKQIVKITKNYNKGCGKHCDINRKENNCGKTCNAYKIRQILELLEIEEC